MSTLWAAAELRKAVRSGKDTEVTLGKLHTVHTENIFKSEGEKSRSILCLVPGSDHVCPGLLPADQLNAPQISLGLSAFQGKTNSSVVNIQAVFPLSVSAPMKPYECKKTLHKAVGHI